MLSAATRTAVITRALACEPLSGVHDRAIDPPLEAAVSVIVWLNTGVVLRLPFPLATGLLFSSSRS